MKKILFALLLLAAGRVNAQYKPVDQGSGVKFVIANLGFDIPGNFTGIDGVINFDAANLAAATFNVSIDASTVNTDNTLRDGHLKDATYFDVKNYPRIRLTSAKVISKGSGYLFTGRLAIKNKTQVISFPFTAQTEVNGITFKGNFKINRKDFDLGGTSTIANKLEVWLVVHALKTD